MKQIRILICAAAILTVSLGLFGLKTNPGGIVGKIDGKAYTYAEYNGILNNYYSYFQSREGKLSADRKKQLNDNCWNELIGRAIYDKEIKRRGLTISDQEAYNIVIKDPPQQVTVIEALKTNGKFDLEKFKKALEMDPKFKTSVYTLVRETMIYDRLFTALKSKAKAKPDSVRTAWFKNNDTASARIIVFDFNKMPEQTATDAEAEAYYLTNRETYKKNPARRYSYIKLSGIPYAKPKADSIYKALMSGADFAQMAIQHSADPGSGKQGGDLGWFTRGRMVKTFEDAAFALADSAISQPVESQFGWHIIQTLGKRKNDQGQDEVHARHILINLENNPAANDMFNANAEKIEKTLGDKGITYTAAELKLTLSETSEFYETDKSIREIPESGTLVADAFKNSVGFIPARLTTRSKDIYFCELTDSLDYHYSPLEKEKSSILQTVAREKKIAANKAAAHDFYEKNKAEDLIAVAERDSLKIVDINDLKAEAYIPEIGTVKALNDSILARNAGQFTPVVEDANNAYIAKVTHRAKATQAEWDKQKSKVMAKANDEEKNKYLNNWYFQQRQKIKVEDNRMDYYELPAPNNPMQQIQINPQ